jgi:hypothetical protein
MVPNQVTAARVAAAFAAVVLFTVGADARAALLPTIADSRSMASTATRRAPSAYQRG